MFIKSASEKNRRKNMFENFLHGYETVLHYIAELTVNTLELVGVLIIIIGSFRAIIKYATTLRSNTRSNIFIDLGRTLAFALEFKMGAEIVNTVIIRDLRELGILAIIIALRAILSVLIHWEIKSEKKSEKKDIQKSDCEEK